MKVQKDKNKRNLHREFENKCVILKSIAKNRSITKSIRWNSELALSMFTLNSHKIRLVKRCIITGRKNKFNKTLNISRLLFLKLARKGLITGLKKSS